VNISVAKGVFVRVILVAVFVVLWCPSVFSQSPTGSIGGIVFDPDAKTIPGAEIIVVNDLTRVQYETKTNDLGIYAVPNLPPGPYRIQASKVGFKTLIKPDIILNVQDAITINFSLPVGATSIAVTVEGGAPMINTTDASVGTVVDRQFAENLPLNGRSFQALIQLTPGVVVTPSDTQDSGQFSVNGQRAASNYWMVDGVSANIGIGSGAAGNGLGGALGSFSALGGTNSLVSVDAMQEFRIQTSTFAPEFGRTPGGQISIVTRSGTNQWHGTAFDYLRNDVLDANNWFADRAGLTKPRERQNDFGGTFSGPVVNDRTFFFFSYEGLRLRLPSTTLSTVPDVEARQQSPAALQPYLQAFPAPNGPEDLANPGTAQFNASYSNPASLDAYSLRMDHNLNRELAIFGRYNYSPSRLDNRSDGGSKALSTIVSSRIVTQTATLGATWIASPTVNNDLRLNFSYVNASSEYVLDNFGGAVPLAALPFPNPYTSKNSNLEFGIFSLAGSFIDQGTNARNIQRQINLVDSASIQMGAHTLKVGVDFRHLAPTRDPYLYSQGAYFVDAPSVETGDLLFGTVLANQKFTLAFRNLGLFAQDTWRAGSRLSLTYGLRWDVDFAPSSVSGPNLAAVTGYNRENLSSLALAARGKPAFQTTYGNVAPRLGVAYQLAQNQNWQTVVRGGFGIFFDLVDSEVGNIAASTAYPLGSDAFLPGPGFGGVSTFPFSAADAKPLPITPSSGLFAFNPKLELPYVLQWNVAVEQSLGAQQTITASYIGSAGRRLLQTSRKNSPNANFSFAELVGNTATSDYDALQVQFKRRMSHGLQALGSYTWSHSIDNASAGSLGNGANVATPNLRTDVNRGPSDFDIRSAFAAGVSYDLPGHYKGSVARALLGGWSVESIVQARSAQPVNLRVRTNSAIDGNFVQIRPNVVPGFPLYLYGPQYPGGKAVNNTPNQGGPGCKGPFCPPTKGQQGDLGRNALRGFGASQWDLAGHREFRIRESVKLQFRAEMFNVLNHPNFAPPVGDITVGNFGLSTQTLGQYLAGSNAGGASFNALYQTGGPRSIQLALKLMF